MTTIRMLPVHEIVRRTFPRPPPTESDSVAMAVGKAIDGALAEFGHQVRRGRRPTAKAMRELADAILEDALAEGAVTLSDEARTKILAEIDGVLQAYRRSEIYGLARPRTRVIVIDGQVGVYAQPDYWDGRGRLFEMKSYRAIPPPPDVALQLRLFQLAYPQWETVLVCLDRHAAPVEIVSAVIPPPTTEETATTLRLARDVGREFGEEKVLEYVEGPFVRYTLPPSPA